MLTERQATRIVTDKGAVITTGNGFICVQLPKTKDTWLKPFVKIKRGNLFKRQIKYFFRLRRAANQSFKARDVYATSRVNREIMQERSDWYAKATKKISENKPC